MGLTVDWKGQRKESVNLQIKCWKLFGGNPPKQKIIQQMYHQNLEGEKENKAKNVFF